MNIPESRYTPAKPDCPNPGHWHANDAFGTECEVSEGIYGLVRMMQPAIVVETGTYVGQTADAICRALVENGHGRLITIEKHPHTADLARGKLAPFIDSGVVQLVCGDAEKHELPHGEMVDLLFCDGGNRLAEIRNFLPFMSNRALILLHDSRRSMELEALEDLRFNGWTTLQIPTPRGVAICRKKEGF